MKELFPLKSQKGFPGGSKVKASACNAGDLGLIPELGRSPGEGNGSPLQYSCLENPMDGGAWWATVHGVSYCIVFGGTILELEEPISQYIISKLGNYNYSLIR